MPAATTVPDSSARWRAQRGARPYLSGEPALDLSLLSLTVGFVFRCQGKGGNKKKKKKEISCKHHRLCKVLCGLEQRRVRSYMRFFTYLKARCGISALMVQLNAFSPSTPPSDSGNLGLYTARMSHSLKPWVR